jgi:O-antigen ligase
MGMSLPLSKYLVSVSVFLLIANWIVAGNFKNKWMIGHQRKSLLLILSVLLVYCLGMIYTENSEDGLKRILSLMPLMAMTVILGTERPISRSELKVVLLAFVFAVCISSVISIGHYYGWFNRDISDIRQISVFISHLLLSLMVNMAIILLLYMVFYKYFATSKTENVFYLTLAAGLIYFIFLLKSFLGITVFVIFFPLFLFYWFLVLQGLYTH